MPVFSGSSPCRVRTAIRTGVDDPGTGSHGYRESSPGARRPGMRRRPPHDPHDAGPHIVTATQDVLVVIPSISTAQLRSSRSWITAMQEAGFRVRILANAKSVAQEPAGAPVLDTGDNPGFSASILRAVRAEEPWSWLVIANDDLQVGPADIARLRALLAARGTDPAMILFDPEPPRPIPAERDVLAMISLAANVAEAIGPHLAPLRRLLAPGRVARPLPGTPYYKAFNLVAISRSAWEATGGLDPRLLFCYEDADLTARYITTTGRLPESVPLDVRGERSASTRRHIATVLPVITYSAREYLLTLGVRRPRADRLIAAALCIRALLAPFAHAPLGAHLRGIRGSLGCLRRRTVPRLPDYRSL